MNVIIVVGPERVGCHVTSERRTYAAFRFDRGGSEPSPASAASILP